MMVVVGVLRLSGFFRRLTDFALTRIRGPVGLLAAVIVLSGGLSAFLINDVVCVALTPLVLHLARRLKYDPVPHLIGLATAANIGSAGTITGNPQNIFIGSHSHISYFRFALRLMPLALLGLVVAFLTTWLVYRRRLAVPEKTDAVGTKTPTAPQRSHQRRRGYRPRAGWSRWRRWCCSSCCRALDLPVIALGAAAVVLLDRIKPEKIYRQVDWTLLVMFTGLFLVVHAFQIHVVTTWGVPGWTWLLSRPVDLLSVASAALSNLVSNVPAVLLFEPVVQAMPAASRETAWLALAMSSTFAGQFDRSGIGGQPDRGGAGPAGGRYGVLFGVLQGRRAADAADAGAGRGVVDVRAVLIRRSVSPSPARGEGDVQGAQVSRRRPALLFGRGPGSPGRPAASRPCGRPPFRPPKP